MQGRAETKRGDQVIGSYQYSDGNVKVKVVYAADDDGYRVLKEERVTLKPFAESEVPYQKPEVTQKKPKGKPGRPKPVVYKHPKTKPDFPQYQHDSFPGNGQSGFQGSNSDIFSGNSPSGISSVKSTNVFSGENHDVFSSNSPSIFSSGGQSLFNGNKGVFSNTPDLFSGQKPDIFSGKTRDVSSAKAPDVTSTPSTKKPDSQDGKYSSSYSGGPQGLKLPSLDGLDNYSVKLRTNHGSGYSIQGFASSPGKPQKVKVGKNGKSVPVGNEPENPFESDDQFNHSLENHDFPRPSGNRPLRNSRPKPKGRKRRTKIGPTDHLAFFVKDPPIDPKVVLFRPHSSVASKPKNRKRNSFPRPAGGLRL